MDTICCVTRFELRKQCSMIITGFLKEFVVRKKENSPLDSGEMPSHSSRKIHLMCPPREARELANRASYKTADGCKAG